ncbi:MULTISPECIES: IS3 family transposase [unclassified Colwellia]|uniref:IS3 family transposase n=1 Tax=unclassified Colwellia TaxID=196834 RepID=UPI0015F54C68|nr:MULTISPECIES: IS3 family transposase [unclassified Colwellia]MBA6379170.1 IS3 family transposase [Colwellia sp. BRX10-7]MBA6386084.1 IS3 family transposase [Colwellia sp. BRX10-2]MBA6401943.1 IS3 family transposase [Colwellia sp. BRX10-5]MBA6406488.1 IS3 family transposase [Colwellia sp. BRX10-1]
MKNRKTYSKEFKLDAIALVRDQNYAVAEAARNLDVSAQVLGRWIKEAENDDGHAFRGNGKLTPEQDEIRKLKAQVKRLEMERENIKKSDGLLCQRNEVKYSFVTQHKKIWPVILMCRVLGIKSNNYYSYQKRKAQRPIDTTHQEMLEWVKDIAKFSDNTYGERRIQKALNALSFPVSRRKTAQLMKEANVWVRYKKKYKVTTNSEHNKPVYANELEQDFDVQQPNQAWVQDITYIWTSEGWLYLAIVIDLYSRKVVGWSMGSRMKAQLVCDALTMAMWQRKPKAGLIVHSDQGVQYASHQYRRILRLHGFVGSMSKKGCCWDNAVAESFFGSLKQERVHWRNYRTRYAAQQDVLNYITMWYNSNRMHSYLGYQNPNEFECKERKLKKVA